MKKGLPAMQENAQACADRLARSVGLSRQERALLTMMLARVGGTASDTDLIAEVLGTDTRVVTRETEHRKPHLANQRMFNVNRIINKLSEHEDSESPHAEDDWWDKLYDGVEFLDDMNGYTPLDKERVIAARRLEIEYFKKMGVYEKVDRSEVAKMKGKVITTKWLDTNVGDLDTPNYRSRLVGREINRKKRLDLFSATPPLEAFKILLAKCALGGKKSRLAVIDIKRAYFYAPATRPIFVEIPEEDRAEGDEGKVGRLMLSLYGTRDAAQNLCTTYTQFLLELGFTRGLAPPCDFRHNALELDLTVHGDDFLVVGGKTSISWLTSRMTNKFEAKVNVIGPDADEEKEV